VKLTRGRGERSKDPGDDVVLITKEGMSIRFHESDVRSMGRAAAGVRGIEPRKGDALVAAAIVVPRRHLAGRRRKRHRQTHRLRRVPHSIPRRQRHHHHEDHRQDRRRGGRPDRAETDEIMLITAGGQMVRIPVKGIREAGQHPKLVKPPRSAARS
jgi:DNA gyrase subunit A